jgi:hypothetical protein
MGSLCQIFWLWTTPEIAACPPPSSSNSVELPIADAVIAEAASQVRRLLRVPSPPGLARTAWEQEENRHV